MNVEEQVLKFGELEIALKIWGSSSGSPVLALHGWMDNAASFDNIAPLLDGIRLFAIDFPGHGLSSHRLEGAEYYIWSYIEEVIAISELLNLKSFSLLGHSMGGAVACLVAALFPEKVSQLALLDALGPISTRVELAPQQMRKALSQKNIMHDKKPRLYPSKDEAVQARAKRGISMESATMLAGRGLTKKHQSYFWHSDPRLAHLNLISMDEELVAEFLKEIKCPTLMIGSSNTWEKRAELFELRKSYFKNIEIVQLEGNHHQHMEGDVSNVARQLNQFFKE